MRPDPTTQRFVALLRVTAAWMAGIKSFMKVGRVPEHIQHWEQLGGYFVVDGTGKVLYGHACESAMDNPDLEELLDALGVKGKT